jgi:tetratricopeptide (TPR) repeat protein
VEFEVELVDFQPTYLTATASPEDHLAAAERLKTQGNTLFTRHRLTLAADKYTKALHTLGKNLQPDTEEQFDRAEALRVSCHCNLAACAIKDGKYAEAVAQCSKALAINEGHAKSLFRRGQAKAAQLEFEAARGDLRAAAVADPGCEGEVEREIRKIDGKEREAVARQKRDLKSFFDR